MRIAKFTLVGRADNPAMPGFLVVAIFLFFDVLVLSSLVFWHLLSWSTIGLLAMANLWVVIYVCNRWPRYYVGLVAGFIRYVFYRFQVRGLENIPRGGAVILICNHVSYIDVPLLMAASPRPLVFWVHHSMFEQKLLGDFLRASGAIAVATKQQDEVLYEAALQAAVSALQRGQALVIFPEGRITRDGQLQAFKSGVLKIVQRTRNADQALQPRIIPMALRGMWGSYFSWVEPAGPMKTPLRRGWLNRVELRVGKPLPSVAAEAEELRSAVAHLLIHA